MQFVLRIIFVKKMFVRSVLHLNWIPLQIVLVIDRTIKHSDS